MLTIRQEQGIQDIDRLCYTCHAHIPGIAVEDVERQCSCNGIAHRTLLIQRRARIKCTAVPVAPLADNQFTFSRRCLERAFRFWKRFKPGVDQAALFVDDTFQFFASVDDIIPLFLIKFLLGLKLLQIPVVKMEIIPDQSTDLYGPSSTEDIAEITKPVATMELQIGQAVLRISNQTDPRLLEQTLKLIGAFSC